jgi:hypothetical protein
MKSGLDAMPLFLLDDLLNQKFHVLKNWHKVKILFKIEKLD